MDAYATSRSPNFLKLGSVTTRRRWALDQSKELGEGERCFSFPRSCWPLSSSRKGDAEDAEKGGRFVGFLVTNCHIWGGPEHPRCDTAAAQQSGVRLPRGLRHMGLPDRDSVGSGHWSHRERSSGGAARIYPSAGSQPVGLEGVRDGGQQEEARHTTPPSPPKNLACLHPGPVRSIRAARDTPLPQVDPHARLTPAAPSVSAKFGHPSPGKEGDATRPRLLGEPRPPGFSPG